MRIALDAMGGDRAPGVTVQGALWAAREGVEVLLVGEEGRLKEELARHGASLPVYPASDWIRMEEHATEVRRRRESSIMVAMDLLKRGEVGAVVSMGHTGATMAAALFTLGRVKGVERPALLVEFPSQKGRTFLLDGGANADCRPGFLLQFAAMGLAYAEAHGLSAPRVGLLSIGEEEGKGNALVLEAYPLLKAALGPRFYGNVEGRDIFLGTAEVVVTDGFTGNVALKLAEGEAKVLLGWIKEALTSSPWARLGALLARGALRRVRDRVDPSQYGAMPLLGVEGAVFIGHGSADALAVKNALLRAKALVEAGLMDRVRQALQGLHV
ncbi:phosphate acyltransferase PlsX [Thermus sp.]|uniref:phosphate acyltransferase PlsX n=1 Tax=Thermus sp. TaxID=275 RepID=UPI0025DF4114|nr:phosphate acyltransferase PlsX [Thermus sp.]MCS6869142.1 phosphate acyltransferase PlsX [Thermus sp.]MCX7849655.1 phosphate acyltransferase PlsX [Thermus sp.]MDW8017899.1 phosphate acyltransferase PlsX [Thermus sp.]MDW8356583.1 phosphate acyltransferase PlsX [Thermus sp.]